MTMKTNNLSDLFDHTSDPPTVYGAIEDVRLKLQPEALAIGIHGTIVHIPSGDRTNRQLFLMLRPQDATGLAAAILALAREKGWPMPDSVERFEEGGGEVH